jgi:hypothetical protein
MACALTGELSGGFALIAPCISGAEYVSSYVEMKIKP